MAEGKLNIYNLGERGVVIDKSPIHTEDGELLAAQNAMVDTIGGLGAIRKRDGIAKINSSALAGQVTGGIGLPLPDRAALTVTYFLALETSANTWETSTDGTTFTPVTTPTRQKKHTNSPGDTIATAGIGNLGTHAKIALSARGKLYYAGDDYTPGTTAPTLHMWDGTTDVTLTTIPPGPVGGLAHTIGAIVNYSDTELLIVTTDFAVTDTGRVLLFNTETGQLTQIGPETSLTPALMSAITIWQGEIWVGGMELSGSAAPSLFHARVGSATWAQDTGNSTLTSSGWVVDLVVFKGDLYAALALGVDTAETAKIRKKPALSGVWATAVATVGSTINDGFGPMIVSADGSTIFAFKRDTGAVPTLSIIQSTDGASWTEAYNVSANLSTAHYYAGVPILDPSGNIFWPFGSGPDSVAVNAGALLKRTSGGTWSIVTSGKDTYRGVIGWARL